MVGMQIWNELCLRHTDLLITAFVSVMSLMSVLILNDTVFARELFYFTRGFRSPSQSRQTQPLPSFSSPTSHSSRPIA